MNTTQKVYLVTMSIVTGVTSFIGYKVSRKSYKKGRDDGILTAEKFHELNHIYQEALHESKEREIDKILKDIES